MSKLKRFIILLALLTGFTAFSFGEAFYGFTTGLYRHDETFLKENYGRVQDGFNFNFSFNYFFDKSLLGLFIQTSIGAPVVGAEWNATDAYTLNNNMLYDLRFFLGPSFKLQLGNKIRIPISMGPAFSLYREEGGYYYSSSISGFYETIGMGLFADVAFVLNPSGWFFLRMGVAAGWDFLNAERGQMDSQIRTVRHAQYTPSPYAAFYGTIYFGIGIRIE